MIVIHYSEIGTKGRNRDYFEDQLIENVKRIVNGKVYKRYGMIVADTKEKKDLSLIPGVAYYSYAENAKLDLEDIKEKSLVLLRKENFESFKIVSSRSNKNFNLTSPELNEKIGEFIFEKLNKKVKLKNPEKTLFVEVGEKEAFVYTEKIRGIGGLPVGISGDVVCSLSGGLDSPVAGFLMMNRGCKVIFVHVYNKTLHGKGMQEKLKKIVKELSIIQGESKLYMVPFGDIQNEIIEKVDAKYRMIVYRRFMMRIIGKIAIKEKCKFIVTGDSVGQVASQTLENLNCIWDASNINVFAPLIGMNKDSIVDIAKKINTYEHSIMPYPDCCSYMIAKHPVTKSRLDYIEREEKDIDVKLVEKSVSEAELEII